MISTDLEAMKAASVARHDAAIAAAVALETGTQTRQEKDALCAALQGIKDGNIDENEAIDDIMVLVPCGA